MPSHMIHTIELDEKSIIKRHPDIEQERALAIRDILKTGQIRIYEIQENTGPYHMKIGLRDRRLVINVEDFEKKHTAELSLSLSPYKRIIKDYFLICDSYTQTQRMNDQVKLETIDMARRGLHNEGAQILSERIQKKAEIDHDTARALFTLMCVLHIGTSKPW